MSASAFLAVQSGLVSALQASTALAGVPVYVNRVRALPADVAQAVVVTLVGSRVLEGPLGVRDWETSYQVEAIARGQSGLDPAAAVDDLMQATAAALLDLDVAGAWEVFPEPTIDWTFDAGDTPLVSAALAVTVRHRTPATTLVPLA